jgi:hypothetical protein
MLWGLAHKPPVVVEANCVVSVLPKIKAPAERRTPTEVASIGMTGEVAKVGGLNRVGISTSR